MHTYIHAYIHTQNHSFAIRFEKPRTVMVFIDGVFKGESRSLADITKWAGNAAGGWATADQLRNPRPSLRQPRVHGVRSEVGLTASNSRLLVRHNTARTCTRDAYSCTRSGTFFYLKKVLYIRSKLRPCVPQLYCLFNLLIAVIGRKNRWKNSYTGSLIWSQKKSDRNCTAL